MGRSLAGSSIGVTARMPFAFFFILCMFESAFFSASWRTFSSLALCSSTSA